MAEAKFIEYVAVERGFVGNRLIEPGTSFEMAATRKSPKWAVKKGDPLPAKANRKPSDYDLRPREASDAVKVKAGALTGSDLA